MVFVDAGPIRGMSELAFASKAKGERCLRMTFRMEKGRGEGGEEKEEGKRVKCKRKNENGDRDGYGRYVEEERGGEQTVS